MFIRIRFDIAVITVVVRVVAVHLTEIFVFAVGVVIVVLLLIVAGSVVVLHQAVIELRRGLPRLLESKMNVENWHTALHS